MRRLFLEMKFSNAPLSRSDHRLPASGIAPLVPALVRSLIEERPKQCPHFRPHGPCILDAIHRGQDVTTTCPIKRYTLQSKRIVIAWISSSYRETNGYP